MKNVLKSNEDLHILKRNKTILNGDFVNIKYLQQIKILMIRHILNIVRLLQ